MKTISPKKKSGNVRILPTFEEIWASIQDIMVLVMFFVALAFVFMVLTSCSTSINMVNSSAPATDVVDTAHKTDADVSPNLSIPMPL